MCNRKNIDCANQIVITYRLKIYVDSTVMKEKINYLKNTLHKGKKKGKII